MERQRDLFGDTKWQVNPSPQTEADAHHIKTMGKRLGLMSGKVWLQANHDLNEHNPTMEHNWQAKFARFCQARLDLPKTCKHLQRWAQECPPPGPLRWMPAWKRVIVFWKKGWKSSDLDLVLWWSSIQPYITIPLKHSPNKVPTAHSNSAFEQDSFTPSALKNCPSKKKAVYQNQLVKSSVWGHKIISYKATQDPQLSFQNQGTTPLPIKALVNSGAPRRWCYPVPLKRQRPVAWWLDLSPTWPGISHGILESKGSQQISKINTPSLEDMRFNLTRLFIRMCVWSRYIMSNKIYTYIYIYTWI